MNPCDATSATKMALRSSSFVADMVEGDVVEYVSEMEEESAPEASRRCSSTRRVVSFRMPEGDGEAEAEVALIIFAEDRAVGRSWGEKRYTSAEFVSAPNQVRNVSASSHGPIVSVREGTGRRLCTVILNASERSSRRLFRKAITRKKIGCK